MPASLRTLFRAAALTPYWLGRTWSAEQIARYQISAIRSLACRAAREVPFYRDLFKRAGIDPPLIRTFADVARLPVVTKCQTQSAGAAILADGTDPARVLRLRTSGSTGKPVEIVRTTAEERLLGAFRLKALGAYGMSMLDRRVGMTTVHIGPPMAPDSPNNPPWARLGLYEFYGINVLGGPQAVLARLRQLRPQVIESHADALWRLCLEIPSEDLRNLKVRIISAGAQTVTSTMRRQIEEAFQLPLYVTYGTMEHNLLASECPRSGLYHLCELSSYVEVLDNGSPAKDGESGTVVATNLHSTTMPFIRYDLGDWATMGPPTCPCGSPFRTLRSIHGRVAELFHLPGGGRFHPFLLANQLLSFTGWLGEYRLIQEQPDLINVPFVAVRGVAAPLDACEMINRVLAAAVGHGVRIQARQVSSIPPFIKGANRIFESRVPD